MGEGVLYWATEVNEAVKWSALSKIGGSLLARLTILAPFVGYLIIYNDYFRELFYWTGLRAEGDQNIGIMEALSEKRLHFFYFGLVFFGIASSLYSFFAPRQVAHFKSVERFVVEMEEVKTPALTVSSLDNVNESFFKHNQGETLSPFFNGAAFSFPDRVREPLFNLANSLFEAVDDSVFPEGADNGAGQFYTGSGYVVSDAVLEVLKSRLKFQRALWESMLDDAFARKSKDIFYLDFVVSDYSRTVARCLCAFLFLVGASLLLIPTILTSILVLTS